MPDQPILSICIPTSCRANNLDLCLGVIFGQIIANPNLLSNIEIIVSDNARIDDTSLVVNKYIKKYANIKYFVNKENLGFDENCINSVINSTGKYAWIIGDDDFILNGALEHIVKYLKVNTISIYTLQTETFVDMEAVYQKKNYPDNIEQFLPKSHNDFFAKNYCIGLLSSIIFNRQMWLSVDRAEYFTGWLYYEIALKMIAQSNLPFVHNSTSLVSTMQSCDWVKGGTEFYVFINWKKILKKLPNFGYNIDYINQILIPFPKKLIIILLRSKANGLNYKIHNLKIMINEFGNSPFYLMLAIVIFFVPNYLIKIIRESRKNINTNFNINLI